MRFIPIFSLILTASFALTGCPPRGTTPTVTVTVGTSKCPPDKVKVKDTSAEVTTTSGQLLLSVTTTVVCVTDDGEQPLAGVPLKVSVLQLYGPVDLGPTGPDGKASNITTPPGDEASFRGQTFNVDFVGSDGVARQGQAVLVR